MKSATKWGILGRGKIANDFVTALGLLPDTEHRVRINLLIAFSKKIKLAVSLGSVHYLREGVGKMRGASNFCVARKGGGGACDFFPAKRGVSNFVDERGVVSKFGSVKRGVCNFSRPSSSFPAPIT